MKRIIKYSKRLFILSILGICFILISNYIVKQTAKSKTFNTVSKLEKHKVGLVLGAVKTISNGKINLYYKYRIDAVVALYKANKIDYILVSGDNGRKAYDEPSTFKEDLIKRGIP